MKIVAYKDYGSTNFITGLRAFAALSVVMIHAGGAGLREFGPIGNYIADLGKTGVYVFFVISGYSVSASYETSLGYFHYLMKRILRIAPLYYFWLIVAIFSSATPKYWQDFFAVEIDTYNILMHFTFLSFLDYRITNSILGVEWSISIEVFWYFLIPFLVTRSQNIFGLFIWIVLSLIAYKIGVSLIKFTDIPQKDIGMAVQWSPVTYIFSYMLGVFSYRIRAQLVDPNDLREVVPQVIKYNLKIKPLIFIIFILILISCFNLIWIKKIFADQIIVVSIITCVFIAVGSEKNKLIRLFFTNKIVIFIGTISYGIYLSHLPILNILTKTNLIMDNSTLKFIVLVFSSIIVSTLTYNIIEIPGASLRKYFRRHEEN